MAHPRATAVRVHLPPVRPNRPQPPPARPALRPPTNPPIGPNLSSAFPPSVRTCPPPPHDRSRPARRSWRVRTDRRGERAGSDRSPRRTGGFGPIAEGVGTGSDRSTSAADAFDVARGPLCSVRVCSPGGCALQPSDRTGESASCKGGDRRLDGCRCRRAATPSVFRRRSSSDHPGDPRQASQDLGRVGPIVHRGRRSPEVWAGSHRSRLTVRYDCGSVT
jgi:hypothetical protein